MKNKQAVKKSLSQWCINNYKNSDKVASKHDDIKYYLCKAVIADCLSNVSMASLVERRKSWCDKFPVLSLGD